MNQTVARLCRDRACTQPVAGQPETFSWQQSTKLVLPASCATPPCWLELSAGAAGVVASLAVNAPDVWWAMSGTPAAGSPPAPGLVAAAVHATIIAGEPLRVFGRSLAWTTAAATPEYSAAALRCANASLAPRYNADTVLVIAKALDARGVALVTPPAGEPVTTSLTASCYEATFDSGQFPNAAVRVPAGRRPPARPSVRLPSPLPHTL